MSSMAPRVINGYFNYTNYGTEWVLTVSYRYSSRDTVFEYKVQLQLIFQTCMAFGEEFMVHS
jgi:hypothetical protein